MKKRRLPIVATITSIAYLVCTSSLFTTNTFFVPFVSFMVLFIGIYFLAIDLYARPTKVLRMVLATLMVLEMLFFGDDNRHSYVQIFLFHLTIAVMFYVLFYQLKNRISFSAFSYFTEGGYTIAALLTLFFSVLMLGKYSQIPFSCEDIDNFPQNLFSTSVDKVNAEGENLKSWRNKWKALFGLPTTGSPTTELLTVEGSVPVQKTEIELFFERSKEFLQTEALELQGSITKNSCEFVMNKLKTTQKSDGLQLAVMVLMYFLLIGVFKILLWIVSFVGFFIFLLIKPLKWYQYERKRVEKESIV